MNKKLLVVGNGMVAGRFLDELLSFPDHGYDITVLSAEPHGSYNRIMLSSVLTGEASLQEIIQKTPAWYSERCIDLQLGQKVVHINGAKRQVLTAAGDCLDYDELVIATGSRPSSIPASSAGFQNVYPFRSITDTETLLEESRQAKRAIVVGGGFLGLEAAWGLASRGVEVTVIHRSKHLLNRQLDAKAGAMLQSTLEASGLRFCMGAEIETFLSKVDSTPDAASTKDRVAGAKLSNGDILECDFAVVATGITPNAEIGWEAGLEGDRGILVDEFMRSSEPNISSIGECIQFEKQTFGLVDPLWQQAKVLATRLAQPEASEWIGFSSQPIATKLKISGVQLYSAGVVDTPEDAEEWLVHDPASQIYRKVITRSGQIIGLVLYGDVRSGAWMFDLMVQGEDVSSMLPNLAFGQDFISAA